MTPRNMRREKRIQPRDRQEDRLPETEARREGDEQAGQVPTAHPGSCWAGPNQCKMDGCFGKAEAARPRPGRQAAGLAGKEKRLQGVFESKFKQTKSYQEQRPGYGEARSGASVPTRGGLLFASSPQPAAPRPAAVTQQDGATRLGRKGRASPLPPGVPLHYLLKLPPANLFHRDILQAWCQELKLSTKGQKLDVYKRICGYKIDVGQGEMSLESPGTKIPSDGTYPPEVAAPPERSNALLEEVDTVMTTSALDAVFASWSRIAAMAGKMETVASPQEAHALFLLPACNFPPPQLCSKCVQKNKVLMKSLQ
ncbi:unnamed protein product [Nyctereutes procyonoides]|uniref:(raccoon dog) hypothetical protein n=1 Tax=Nyctereutes procyonoides TaxID=34880 RepID=A0A811Z859_NYCPR|nr:unnamed protein product [Nyctereutes procyonoides]